MPITSYLWLFLLPYIVEKSWASWTGLQPRNLLNNLISQGVTLGKDYYIQFSGPIGTRDGKDTAQGNL